MMKKKTLNLDGKKRITLGKLIPRETTFFEVEKRPDGTLILRPKSDLPANEILIYKDKSVFKLISKGLVNLKRGLITKVGAEFWGDESLKHLRYTHEFLKSLETFAINDENFEQIKLVLQELSPKTAYKLENIKTKSNDDIYQSKMSKSSVFWTYTKLQEEITVIALIK